MPAGEERGVSAPVLVLDFGAQYNQLIARRIRELEVYCELVPGTLSAQEIAARKPAALVLSGGPASVFDPGAPRCDPAIFQLGLPILGICYGMQLMAFQLGGEVVRAERPEYGRRVMTKLGPSALLEDVPEHSPVWMSHGDMVRRVPPGFVVLAATETTPVAAMGDPARNLWGVQYHPEVHHTPHGQAMLRAFLYQLAQIAPDWRPTSFIAQAVAQIEEAVGPGRALIALSGGVDSAVAAALAERALGRRLTAVLIDHGLMRSGEVEEVEAAFPHLDLRVVRAGPRFLEALRGVTDPEAKRKIIGAQFIKEFEQVAESLGAIDTLIQGTVYPDVIESGHGSGAHTIKSHHNVGGLPDWMRLKVVEPLRLLFKDEVRRVGLELGLPPSVVWRQPFPGPGLAVRIVGEVTAEAVEMVRAADAIVREETARLGQSELGEPIWQAFAVLLDIRSVGVMGDQRTYGRPVVVRAVHSEDGMTADWVRLDPEVLDRIAHRVVAEVPGVNRVVYDITSKPPGTIEWE
ncbi:MAG: glutamine-hydrolyzing GMP synthase [Firmicutes bacterium]|nr:glutamine-hydrolyzing GMP synthase [Bacillota bacterium]